MTRSPNEFHLILDCFSDADETARRRASPGDARNVKQGVLAIEEGPHFLSVGPADQTPRITTQHPDSLAVAHVLETVRVGHTLHLLVLSPADATPRVNDQPAPRVALLREGDLLRLDGACSMRVAIYHRLTIGPAGPEHIGKECPLCRVPIAEGTTIYACDCGAALHCESPPASGGAEPLECARLSSECPACAAPVFLKEGYSQDPGALDD